MITTVLTGSCVFLSIILVLIALLLYTKRKLTPEGDVVISVNNDRNVEVEPGSSLLVTLANQKIFLSSACGGGGTCGMCRCKVVEGGGSILPTETGFFTRKEQLSNWRLGCQVKVRQNMKIEVSPAVFGVKKWDCEVISNHNVATYIKEFVVKLPENETLNFKSGGYIQVDVPLIEVDYQTINVEEDFRPEWDKYKMWDLKMKNPEPVFRAYSMANAPSEGNVVMLNVRIATPPFDRKKGGFMHVNPGLCSSYIFSRKPGDKITISGPYGEFFIKDTQNEMMFIGGGAGMAPMRSHIFDQFLTKHTARKASFWYGGRSLRELFYIDQFEQIAKDFPNFSFHVALSEPLPEDHWKSATGFIHQVIYDQYLKNHPAPEEIEYYICGPALMTEAVLQMLDNLGVPKENIMFDDFGN